MKTQDWQCLLCLAVVIFVVGWLLLRDRVQFHTNQENHGGHACYEEKK